MLWHSMVQIRTSEWACGHALYPPWGLPHMMCREKFAIDCILYDCATWKRLLHRRKIHGRIVWYRSSSQIQDTSTPVGIELSYLTLVYIMVFIIYKYIDHYFISATEKLSQTWFFQSQAAITGVVWVSDLGRDPYWISSEIWFLTFEKQ